MCGLFGFTTAQGTALTQEQKHSRFASLVALGIAMESRGTHSTGVAAIAGETVEIVKRTQAASGFMRTPEVMNACLDANMVIGHTRWATIGAVIERNAHPFQKGKIVGAHNGSVYNFRQIDGEALVDSEAIFTLLKRHNNEYEAVFPQLSGLFAVTWVDMNQPSKLHVVTHTNPYYYFISKKLNTLFWASEETALNIIQAAVLNESSQIYYPPDDQVFVFDGKLELKARVVGFKTYTPAKTATTPARQIVDYDDIPYYSMYGGYEHGGARDEWDDFDSPLNVTLDDTERCANCSVKIDMENGDYYYSEDDASFYCDKHGVQKDKQLIYIPKEPVVVH